MAYQHTKKVWKLDLCPTEKLILMVLCDHAKLNDDKCWPGYERIAERSGYCKKTVQRSIVKLEKLGLITIERDKHHNVYILHVAHDFKVVNKYLNCPHVLSFYNTKKKYSLNEDSKTSETINKNTNNNLKIEEGNNWHNEQIVQEKQPSSVEDSNPTETYKKPKNMTLKIEEIWKGTYCDFFQTDFNFTPKDRWNLLEIEEYCSKNNYPAHYGIILIIMNWNAFIKNCKLENIYKKLDPFPNTTLLKNNMGIFINTVSELQDKELV